ncbi:YcxB family protein [Cellulomonas cellasea]|uniref:YcxB family protein n=1 Tax=Cellulomonas cellasea TaxID=43670 RepID=UPI001144FCC3|nr:YcxB family protein [Cellulomonas cellasea]
MAGSSAARAGPGPAGPRLTIAILLWQLAGYGQRGTARGIWKNNSMFRLPVEAHVAPGHGITTTSPGMSSWYDWSRIARVQETPRVFVLQIDENRGGPFFVLAKRGLPSPHDLAVLRTVLSVEVGSRSGTVLLLTS